MFKEKVIAKYKYYLGMILLFGYCNWVPSTVMSSQYESVLTLFLCIVLLYRVRSSPNLFLGFVFIAYSMYSVVIGEYIVGGNLGVPLMQVKTVEIYGLVIRIMLFFFLSLLTFFPKNFELPFLKPKNNLPVFIILVLILIYIGLFGISRVKSGDYTVNISSLYEYSTIIFLFAYYSSGDRFYRKVTLTLLIFLFILQDFYYGGRITSIQLIFLFLCTIYRKSLNIMRSVLLVFLGIFTNSFIGIYRKSFSINSVNILSLLEKLISNFFVFDTPVYSYYASATHIATIELFNLSVSERLDSFKNFIFSIFWSNDGSSGNLTQFVSKNYFYNIGGGFAPTHFYFWGGWIGVLFLALLISWIFAKALNKKNDLWTLIVIVTISTIPRWFLYNPLILVKMPVIIIILYFIFKLGMYFFSNTKYKV